MGKKNNICYNNSIMPNKDRWVHSKCMKLYLQVNKVEPPIRGVAGGIDHHQQGILEAVD